MREIDKAVELLRPLLEGLAKDRDERLSNQVYHYDRELRRVCLATDTHHKCLTD